MSTLGRLVQVQAVRLLTRSLPALSYFQSLLLVCFCALAVHKFYNKFEVNPANFLVSFLLLGVTPMLPFPFVLRHLESKFVGVFFIYSLFYFFLALSIILYRLSPFHSLAKHPGPSILKVSKLAMIRHAYTGKQHIFFKELHDKYGPCVRIGPNALSIVDVDAIQPIFGVDGTRKGPQYVAHNIPGTIPNIATVPDVDSHRERRKLWNRAFTTSALKDYQPMVAARVLQLDDELSKRATKIDEGSKPVNLAEWMAFFTYDVMGDMVFNGGLEFIRDGDDRKVVKTLEQALRFVAIIEHIPWITRLVHRLPLTSEDYERFVEFAVSCVKDRKDRGSTKKDLFHFITNEDRLEDVEVPPDQVISDSVAAIVAGADTTSTVLGGIFYYLLTHRDIYERLRAEIDTVFPAEEGYPLDTAKLTGMLYLNAVINEVLRLQPPVPSAMQRSPLVGSGGKLVLGRFIPENAAIYVPPYVLHRDPRYFSPSPDSFIPERWLSNSTNKKYTTNTAAFIPFSSGPANCAGKNLALMEMRMVVATLVQRFNMRLAEGYDPSEWEDQLQDHFVMKTGRLPIVLTSRE